MTKLADTAPSHCSACFQAGSDKHYIDFEAAYDGPVIPGSPEPVPVDDLILCEDCLQTAFVLLDPRGERREIERLESELEEADRHIEGLEKLSHGALNAANELVDHPIRKHQGRRGYQLENTDAKKVLEQRRIDKAAKRKKVKA
jgi:hypothetical protein